MRDELVYEEESYALRGAIFEVYKTLGNGYLEEVYQNAHEEELRIRKIGFRLGLLVNFSAYPKVDIRRRVV